MTEQLNPIVDEQPTVAPSLPVDQYTLKYAGFWTRLWAYTIDLVILSALSGIFIKPIFRAFDWSLSNPFYLLFSPYKITILIITLLYFMLMTKFTGQTIGKMIVGIRVVQLNQQKLTWGTILFREGIGRFISKTLVIPYLLVAFMPKKEALHDLFAETVVIHENVYSRLPISNQQRVAQSHQLQEQSNVQ